MKFTAAALLIASVNAEGCTNVTTTVFTDNNCSAADTNETKKTEAAAVSK